MYHQFSTETSIVLRPQTSLISTQALGIITHLRSEQYVEGPKNIKNFFLEGRGALVPSAPAWCVYVTARCIIWPRGVLEERSTGSV